MSSLAVRHQWKTRSQAAKTELPAITIKIRQQVKDLRAAAFGVPLCSWPPFPVYFWIPQSASSRKFRQHRPFLYRQRRRRADSAGKTGSAAPMIGGHPSRRGHAQSSYHQGRDGDCQSSGLPARERQPQVVVVDRTERSPSVRRQRRLCPRDGRNPAQSDCFQGQSAVRAARLARRGGSRQRRARASTTTAPRGHFVRCPLNVGLCERLGFLRGACVRRPGGREIGFGVGQAQIPVWPLSRIYCC